MDVKTLIRNNLINKNHYLAKFSYYVWFGAKLLNKQPIVIYTMGKVGSTTILNSLKEFINDRPIFQVHALTDQGISRLEQNYFGENSKTFHKALLPETKHLYTSYFLHAQVNEDINSKKWKIVSLVRDPIARNVSEFFYSVDTTKHDPYLPNFYKRSQSNTIDTTELMSRFLDLFHENSDEYKLSLKWFEIELKSVTGLDVFSSNFPKEIGYKIYQGEWADALIIKLERLNECSAIAFKEFLGIENFRLISANLAREKSYYSVYNDFIRNDKLPKNYLNSVYNSKYVCHFYTRDEVDSFWNKWHKSTTS